MENTPDRPFQDSYWVVPGKFLAGAYPGDYDRTFSRVRITALLNAGFDTFFDLTTENELPPYAPILLEEAAQIGRRVTHHHFSISDYGVPSQAGMHLILDAIDQALSGGHQIYLHCWAGVGRTGTTVGCFLARHGLTGQEALQKVAELFQTASQSKNHPASPESASQVDFILNWHES
jgi:hypothetical protein